MNFSSNYRFYLLISLISLFLAGLLSLFQENMDFEELAFIAFIFFAIAVVMVAKEEFFASRPHIAKKFKSLFRRWKK